MIYAVAASISLPRQIATRALNVSIDPRPQHILHWCMRCSLERKSNEELGRFLDVAARDFPDWYPFILFMAHVGARLGEASAFRWIDVDLDSGVARISRSFSDGQFLSAPKTRKERTVELSDQL